MALPAGNENEGHRKTGRSKQLNSGAENGRCRQGTARFYAPAFEKGSIHAALFPPVKNRPRAMKIRNTRRSQGYRKKGYLAFLLTCTALNPLLFPLIGLLTLFLFPHILTRG